MADYAGPLQRLAVSTTLWMPVAPLLLGLAWHVLRRGRAARAVGVGSVVLATAATIGHVVAFERGGRSALLDSIPGGGRIGWTDVGIELWFDAWSEVGCAAACVLALGMGAWLLATRPAAADDARTWAWLQVALAGALVSLLAGGFATTAIGWTLVAVASVWLAGWADAGVVRVGAARGALGLAGLLLCASVLYAGIGGTWQGEDYVQDAGPRFVALSTGPSESSMTLTSAPGALALLDGARTTGLVAPFVGARVAEGVHTIRIHSPGTGEDALVGTVSVAHGGGVALVALGSTASFREIAAPVDPRVTTYALLVLLVAAGAMSAIPAAASAPGPLRYGSLLTKMALGPFLVARLEPLASFAGGAGTGIALGVSAFAALAAHLAARRTRDDNGASRLGALLVGFERGVIDAIAGACAVLVRAGAWVAATLEGESFEGPGDVLALRAVRAARVVEPWVGGSLGRVAWGVVGTLLTAALLYAIAPVP